MRKLTFFFILFIFTGFVSKALAQSPVRLGLKFNPIISYARITDDDKKSIDELDKNSKLGFSGGLIADFNFSERAAFHTGLLIVSKGYETSIEGLDATTTSNVTAVEVPVALKMRSGDIADGLRIRGLFGGQLGLNVASKTTTEFAGVLQEDRKTSDYYQPLSVDFLVGAGVEYDIETVGTIDFGLSYHHGLTRFNKKDDNSNIRALLNYFSLDIAFIF